MDIQARLQMTMIQIVPFIMAVVFHEVGHGWMAKKWGDNTAFAAGRLTLNPVPHIDPIGTLLFPLINMITGIPILFGWARPVPINPSRFKKYRAGLFWVSLAGPGTNFILALLSALMFGAMVRFLPSTFYLYEPLIHMTAIGVQINFALGLFNLIPLPPLDGSKIVESQLGYEATQKYRVLERYSFFIILALLWSGALNVIGIPIEYFTRAVLGFAGFVFGVPLA